MKQHLTFLLKSLIIKIQRGHTDRRSLPNMVLRINRPSLVALGGYFFLLSSSILMISQISMPKVSTSIILIKQRSFPGAGIDRLPFRYAHNFILPFMRNFVNYLQ